MSLGEIFMLLGFVLSAYAVVGNDVIQTLGTFISSNKDKKWWILWLYLGGILASVLVYTYVVMDHDMTFGRAYETIKEGGIEKEVLKYPLPDPFPWYLILPPVVLLAITRFGIPVSTTFLVLALFGFVSNTDDGMTIQSMLMDVFDSDAKLGKMVQKSLIGYLFAFGLAAVVYLIISRLVERDFIGSRDTVRLMLKGENGNTEVTTLSIIDVHNKIESQSIDISTASGVKDYVKSHLDSEHQKLIAGSDHIVLDAGSLGENTRQHFALVMSSIKEAVRELNATASIEENVETKKKLWTTLQWVSTGLLWATWLQQDLVNIFVYTPRKEHFTLPMLVGSVVLFVGLLGIILYKRGGTIQKLVTSKRNTSDIRSATIIDFLFAIILFGFKEYSTIPMSTTWVFVGLLAGRELMMAIRLEPMRTRAVVSLVLKDLGKILLGLIISLLLAILIVQLK